MKNIAIIFIGAVLLSACGQAVVTRGGAETFTVHYQHGGVNSVGLGMEALRNAANANCASGKWKILEETHDSASQPYGATEWKIKCL